MLTKYTWRTYAVEGVLWLAAMLVYAAPIGIIVTVAATEPTGFDGAGRRTSRVGLANFVTAWESGNFAQAFGTSVFVAIASVVAIIAFSAPAGYAIARTTRMWSRVSFYAFVGGLVVPASLGVIPLYMMMRDLGMVGSVWALIIIYVGGGMPFSVFLYAMFVRALPRDYEESALLDGSGILRAFLSVVFPLLRPVTWTVVILQVIGIYNDFFTPLLYLSGTDFTTMPLALKEFAGQYFTDWGVIFAGLMMAIIPILMFYLALQRNIIKGFAGGLKG